jgi:hypothetical protein
MTVNKFIVNPLIIKLSCTVDGPSEVRFFLEGLRELKYLKPGHENKWGIWGVAPCILNLGNRLR